VDPQAFIGISRLSHTYPGKGKSPDRAALVDVDLNIRAGEMLALLGPNGSGKSTLLRVLTTALKPDAGQILFGGIDLAVDPRAVRRQLGVVFQKPALDRKMSVVENMRAAGQLYGMRANAIETRMRELLVDLGLADRAGEKVEFLSGGLARRVELAKALLPQPSVLVLDEPTTGLDPISRQEFWQQVATLRGEGTTVIVTTHLLDEAEVCDRVAIMHQGKLLACAPPQELQRAIGKQMLTLECDEPVSLLNELESELGLKGHLVEQSLRFPLEEAFSIDRLLERFSSRIRRLSLAHPSLDDVFVKFTGERLAAGQEAS
jgi:ABC-2 type transport system ATP-binding protein